MNQHQIKLLGQIQTVSFLAFILFDFFSISLTQIFGFLGIGAWLIQTHLTRTWNQVRLPLILPFSLFCLANLLALSTSLNPGRDFLELKHLLEIMVFFWVLNSLGKTHPGELFATWFSSIRNHKAGRYLERWTGKLKSVSTRDLYLYGLMFAASLASILGLFQAASSGVSLSTRISGTLSIYITYAGLLIMAGTLTVSYLLNSVGTKRWAALALGLMVISLSFSLSRGAWLGFSVGVLFLVLIRKPIIILALPLLATLLYFVSPQAVQVRFQSLVNFQDVTFQNRLDMWRLGWQIFERYPITGCGFNCLKTLAPDYPEHQKILGHVHNNLLQIAINTGLIGVLTWVYIWINYFLYIAKEYQMQANHKGRWVILGSAAGVLAFQTSGLFECNFYDSEVVLLCYFIMALPWVYGKSNENSRRVICKF
ncbi:MAG: O-antigen ligase family protein [Nitrospinae bacterium]|nr:O-antigen ligase family protein [Nitrospinota bacterium]